MDFFKFFKSDSNSNQGNKSPEFELNNDQIRFVVYQNSSTLLFDTLQVDYLKNKSKNSTTTTPTTPTSSTPIQKPSPNKSGTSSPNQTKTGKIDMLREMMFGTVPMNIQGTTTKIHYLPDSQQVLLTKLFTLNLKREEKSPHSSCDLSSPESTYSHNHSGSNNHHNEQGSKTPQPTSTQKKPQLVQSNSSLDLQSNLNNSADSINTTNTTTNTTTTTTTATCNNNKINIHQSSDSTINTTPTKELNHSMNGTGIASTSTSTSTTNRVRSSSSLGGRIPRSPLSQPKITKLTVAMCVIFGPTVEQLRSIPTPDSNKQSINNNGNIESVSNFHQFIITHFLIIDMRIKFIVKLLKNQLYSKFTNLPKNGSLNGFGVTEINQLYSEVEKFRIYIKDFYTAPRLEKPLWLDTLTNPSTKRQTYVVLLENLRELLPIYNSSKSKFFLSNLISTVLSYNQSWLSNIMSSQSQSSLNSNGVNNQSPSFRCTNEKCNNEFNFQNQFLYQVSQMYGYTGCISAGCKNNRGNYKLSKLIILSQKDELSKKLLNIVSYFWRTFELIVNKNFINPNTSHKSIYKENEYTLNLLESQQSSQQPQQPPPSPVHSNQQPQQPHQSHIKTNNTSKLLNDHFNESLLSSSKTQHTDYTIGTNNLKLPNYFFDVSRSLTGSCSSKYISDFSIMALQKDDFYPKLIDDLRLWIDHHPFSSPIKETNAIIADVSRCKCDIIICSKENLWVSSNPPVQINNVSYPDIKVVNGVASDYISSVLSSIVYLWTIGMPPETCIMFLEDKLRELLGKAMTLNETLLFYKGIKQPIPPSFNLFNTSTPVSSIPIPPSLATPLITPLATPNHSPQSSQRFTNQKQQPLPRSGDYLVLEHILNYLNDCSINNNNNNSNNNNNNNSNNNGNSSNPMDNFKI